MHNIYELAKVGDIGSYRIVVYTDDPGYIPHFHVISRGSNFNACIKILEPEYFNHGGSTDRLPTRFIKSMVEFLSQPRRSKRFIGTNWEYLIDLWNSNNSDVMIPDDYPMPDYLLLNI